MPARKQGLRARAQRHAAVGDDGRLVFDHPQFRDLLDSHATCPSPHVEKETVTVDDARNGFDVPVIVRKPHKNNLGLRMPKQTLSPRDVANATCPKSLIPILDVKLQTSQKRASLDEWCQYWERTPRAKVLNVISLEITGTVLGAQVKAPDFVDKVDWSATAWPHDAPPSTFKHEGCGCDGGKKIPTLVTARRMLGLEPITSKDEEEGDKVQHKNSARLLSPPRVRKYVLMSVAGSFTDFHVDFGGTSVWYHVLRGAKRMYLAPPSEKNLDSFKRWTRGSQREKTFAEYLTGKVCAVDLHEGDTLIIPSGWIHAVYTPVDSMVFGGNFLTMSHVPSQLRICSVEDSLDVAPEARFPNNGAVMWYALLRAADSLNESLAFDADDHSERAWAAFRRAPSTIAERKGLKLLTSFLRKTLQSSKFAAGVTAPPDEIADVCTYATLDAVDGMLKGERCVDVVQKGVRIKCGSDRGLSAATLQCRVRVPQRFHPDNRASLMEAGGARRRKPGELKRRAAAVAGRFVAACAAAARAEDAEPWQERAERRRVERERTAAHAAARAAAAALEMPPLPPLKKPRQAYLRLPPFVEAGETVDVPLPPSLLTARRRRQGPATTRVVVPADALPHRVMKVLVPADDMDVVVGAPAPAPPPTVEEIRAAYQQEQAVAPTAVRRAPPPPPREKSARQQARKRARAVTQDS